jgi:tRNA(Ile2)-agmatinylcytidine synthase
MTGKTFWIGLDDTDSSEGMCTTWLGARLIQDLTRTGFRIYQARLIRLNPTIPYRTRGNAAIAIRASGEPEQAFEIACSLVTKYAEFACEKTHPGVVLCDEQPPAEFYYKALTSICTIPEAEAVLREHARKWKGYKLGRGLIGATAAVASVLPDYTWEYLAYRDEERWGSGRQVDKDSIYTADEITTPHTWDSVDLSERKVVCIPHGKDPVLFGIRGDSPFSVSRATSCIGSEQYGFFQIWLTNQGTDAHLLNGRVGDLREGHSYRVFGTVCSVPRTGRGGHVTFTITDNQQILTCMAFEPTKGFRDTIRSLIPGDRIVGAGSFGAGALNLEKIYLFPGEVSFRKKAPVCPLCLKQMTSAGTGKGYKCRKCGRREVLPDCTAITRTVTSGWHEVPPSARRHLSRPLLRGLDDIPKEPCEKSV